MTAKKATDFKQLKEVIDASQEIPDTGRYSGADSVSDDKRPHSVAFHQLRKRIVKKFPAGFDED